MKLNTPRCDAEYILVCLCAVSLVVILMSLAGLVVMLGLEIFFSPPPVLWPILALSFVASAIVWYISMTIGEALDYDTFSSFSIGHSGCDN